MGDSDKPEMGKFRVGSGQAGVSAERESQLAWRAVEKHDAGTLMRFVCECKYAQN